MEKITLNNLDEYIYHDVTDEGLNIYMWVNKKVKNFYMTLNTKYGSIHTEFKPKDSKNYIKVPNGIAHFLEHLMFYQPDNTTAHEYFTKLGAQINACTTNDFTFYEVFSSSYFKENLNYLLDYVYTPYYTKENIKTERGIITEEIKMYEDHPNAQLIFKTHECLWHKDKRKYLISGTVDDIKHITSDDLYTVYNNFYHPKNMFLVITGNFNPYEASAIIKENLKKKEFEEYQKPQIKEEKEPNKVVNKYYEQEANVEIPKLKFAVKLPISAFKNYKKDELKLYLSIILKTNFGITSKIHEELFNNNIITSSLGYGASIYDTHCILTITAESNYVDEVINKIQETFENLNIDEKTLNRRKKVLISSLVLSYDDIEEVNSLIQDNILDNNDITTDLFETINSLNMDDITTIINKINLANKTIVLFRPASK